MPALAAEMTPDHASSDQPPPILVRGLRKVYEDVEAVRGIDLRVEAGEIFAFVGPNGAGKTTVVEILEGFRSRSAGEVSVLGIDPQRGTRVWRDRLGIVLQESSPDPGLTVQESLNLYAGYYVRPLAADAVLSTVGLDVQGSLVATKLSGGERRRLDLGLALIGDPDLIFLDEPTTGFDPAARRVAWEVINGLRSLGKTIFLTTHYMEEAEYLADRIAVIVDGRIVADGRPGTLGGRDRAATTVVFGVSSPAAGDELACVLGKPLTALAGDRLSLSTTTPLADLERIAGWSREMKIAVNDLEVSRPSLEDIYLSLTGSRSTEAR